MDDDTRARLRRLEDHQIQDGRTLAGLKSDVENQTLLVRAMAPLVNEVATIRGVASNALDKAKEVESDLASRQSVARANKWQLITTAIALAALLVTFGGLIFIILQFAGAGAGP